MRKFFYRYPKLCIALAGLCTMTLLSAAWSYNKKKRPHFDHSQLKDLSSTALPVGDNGVFIGSGKCGGCHGIDPIAYANITEEGELVNAAENWRGTMMANSAKDPFWLAKVDHEVNVNPGHGQALVNKCTSCHAPVGRYTHLMQGNENFTMEELAHDSLARDGVNCGACHQQRMETLGKFFSGNLHYHSDTIWGPYVSEELTFPIFDAAMTSFVGYQPLGNHKVHQSEFCADCHTLITETADLEGNATGTTFIEQATYHEWLNSRYNSEDPAVAQECQGCHMPRINQPIVIASGYSFLPGRQPFGQHWLVGGNTFMLELLKNNIDTLKLTATEQHYDVVLNRTMHMLQNQTAQVTVTQNAVDTDTARYTVKLSNLAGHKFPSGYPARRAYVEFIMTDDNGNEVFHSGRMDGAYDLVNEDSDWEEHYDLINSEEQVQIYEMVMGDVNGNPTTVLERAHHMIKDNRLVPQGFTLANAAYDSTKIVGSALNDINFNHVAGVEGSGTDEIHFHVPLNGLTGNFHVTARLLYQSAPPRYMEEMFGFDTPKINHFEEMYNETGADPVQIAMAETNTQITGVGETKNFFSIGPNPTQSGFVNIQGGNELIKSVNIYTSGGQLVQRIPVNQYRARIELPFAKGTYLMEVETDKKVRVKKILSE
jgi:hypothetical protein